MMRKRVNLLSESLRSSTLNINISFMRLLRVYIAKEDYVANKIELNPSFYTK